MAEETGIQWCDSTFNPWRGCAKVSPGCENCYAEAGATRNPGVLGTWGPRGGRPVATEAYWKGPVIWNRKARLAGKRHRVFCASIADIFEEREDLDRPRARLFRLVENTPHLDWLLLTKRVQYISDLQPQNWRDGWPDNVVAMTSVEDQEWADRRVPHLLRVPARVRGLSVEPLLGPVDLTDFLHAGGIHWVIIGGESGANARPCDLHWVRSLVHQCRHYEVPVFVKQIGAAPVAGRISLTMADRKGGLLEEWPSDLQLREFP